MLFVDDGFANSYEVKVDLTNPVTFTLTDADGVESTPVTVSQPADADVRFWVDFSSDKFVVGMELAELISTSHTLSSISQMTVAPDSSTVVTASVCSHRGRLSKLLFGLKIVYRCILKYSFCIHR